jgi:DNA polymerase V
MSTVVAQSYYPDRTTRTSCPLFMASVSAGFPSPAEDYVEGRLDLTAT